jgi:hypothetical protein
MATSWGSIASETMPLLAPLCTTTTPRDGSTTTPLMGVTEIIKPVVVE